MTQPPSNLGTDLSAQARRQVHAPADGQESVLLNLTDCDIEPITRLERIQSFGFLIAMSRTWVVVRVSANLEEMLGIKPTAALGTTLDSFADSDSLHEIRNRMTGLSATGGVERLYGVSLIHGRAPFDIAIHYAGELCVLEGEPAGLDSRTDAASLVRKMVARLNSHTSLDAFHQDAARQVRSLTGFDRIMIYGFLPDGAGEVIAEIVKPGRESFLGLHYPASDIPLQARALYLRNSFRIIADVSSTTIPLQSRDGPPAEPLDLSLAITRAVSTVHIEYLRNMDVAASLSISIVVEGKLWGLIACHHDTAKLPTFVTRTAAELFGQMYSMTLESRLRLIADHQDRSGREAVARMMKLIAANPPLLTDTDWLLAALREMIQCDGVAITINGAVSTCGATPAAIEIESIAIFLNALSSTEVFVSDNLGSLRPQFPPVSSIAAGVLCIPISLAAGDYIMLFRREQLQDIRWAGAPVKAAAIGDGQRISPRKSFAAFCESVRSRSRAFTEPEQKVAGEIRTGLMEIFLRGSHQNAVEQSLAGGRQEVLIAELNHRVRNVLALIRGLISQTYGEGGDSAKYVESLNGRVHALARAHDRVTRQNWGPAPLNAIFDDEIAAYVPTQRDRFIINGPRVFLAPQAYSAVALIVHELVTNSSKYGALSDSGRVEVTLGVVPEGLRFKWREMGGPVVTVPTRRGFGSVIIERVVPFDLQGTALVSYFAAGLEAEFFIPERHLASADESDFGSPVATSALMSGEAPTDSRPLAGFNVLILEDNLIVALEAEDLLRSLGAASIVAVSTIAAAVKVRQTTAIDFAMLDINLGFENSLGFAAALRASKTPFLFASGYGEQRKPGDSLLAELTVSKPYDREALQSAIALTLARVAP
ncbi:MAG TPA: HWE histidine kinase domain-containing protein [Steroidobacteraceae bacterium]|nr:HWE histidine kinase domain-containing protein [Steroidobacteraceae bacterium]